MPTSVFRLHLLVDHRLDGGQLLHRHRLRVREVESQVFRIHQRAHLAHMCAEHPPEGGVQQVGGRVIGHDQPAPPGIDRGVQHLADFQAAGLQVADMQVLVPGTLRILNCKTHPVFFQDAPIANLAPGLGVERCAVEYHHARLAGLQRIEAAAFRVVEAPYFTGRGNRLIAQEIDPGVGVNLLPQRKVESRRRPSLGALPAHRLLETVHVGAQAALAGDVFREVGRKAVGVVELEDDIPRNHRAPQAPDGLLEQLHASAQGARKALFFLRQRRLDHLLFLAELRIGAPHLFNEVVHQQMKEGFADIQLVAVPQRPPDDAAQYIVSILVTRQHAVSDEEGTGAQVIGDDAD